MGDGVFQQMNAVELRSTLLKKRKKKKTLNQVALKYYAWWSYRNEMLDSRTGS